MNQPAWNRSVSRSEEPRRASSSSVGSLPGPISADLAGPEDLSSRALAGHWREAILAERALGWLLWGGLAAVIVLVSR